MAREIKSYLFAVTPINQPVSGVETAVVEFMKTAAPFEFSHAAQNYLAEHLAWNANRKILTGTVYRLRSRGLPVAVRGTQTHALPLATDEHLGEPMCFAFWPDPGGALVHYSHNGPRHSVLSALLSRMDYPHPIQIEPVIKSDMLAELDQKTYFAGVEFALTDPAHAAELRNFGGPVGDAVEIQNALGGVNIRVEITMGHTKGTGLRREALKGLAKKLARLANNAVDGESPVRAVKVRGSAGEDAPLEELDLLRAREPVTLNVDEQGRHLDCSDCQRKLSTALHERKAKFR